MNQIVVVLTEETDRESEMTLDMFSYTILVWLRMELEKVSLGCCEFCTQMDFSFWSEQKCSKTNIDQGAENLIFVPISC